MKFIQNLLFIVRSLFLMVFSSSSKNVEEIWINEDGTGEYKSVQNLSPLLPFIKMAMITSTEEYASESNGEAFLKNNGLKKLKEIFSSNSADRSFVVEDLLREFSSKKNKTFTLDSFRQKFFEGAGKNNIEFTEIEKESLSNFFESIFKSTLNIKMDMDESFLLLTITQKFNGLANIMFSGLNEVVDIFSKVNSIMSSGDQLQIQQVKQMMGSIPQYIIKSGTVYVIRDAIDLEDMNGKTKQNFQIMKGFMGQTDYKTIIHLPSTVLSTNQNAATYEGNTVTWSIPNKDLYDPSKNLDIKIEFESKI